MDQKPSPLVWQVRLWTKDPRRLYGILFACCLAGLGGWLIFNQALYALIGFAAIAVTTGEYWLPQKYKLDQNGASAKCGLSTTAIEWENVKRVIPDDNGIKLSPLETEGKLAPFRGVYIRFGDKKEEVMRTIQERCSVGV